jgi:hypothetical protein
MAKAKKPTRTGRKPSLDKPLGKTLADAIADDVAYGLTSKSAYIKNGLTHQTHDNHKAWAAEGKEPYASFFAKLDGVKQRRKKRLLGYIEKAATKYYQAAIWLLENLDPEEFSEHSQVKHSGDMTLKVIWENGNGNGGKPHAK